MFDQGKALLIVEDNFDSAVNGNLHEREEKAAIWDFHHASDSH